MSNSVTDQLAALKARMQAKTIAAPAADPLNPPEASSAPVPETAPTPAPAKRGRPAKVKVTDANETKAAEDVKETVTKSDPPPSTHLIDTLYIDCVPLNKCTRSIADLNPMAVMNEALGEGAVDDWRFVDYKGGGMLATSVIEALRRTGGALAFVVDSQSPEGRACLETLKAHSQYVVKGV